MTESPKYNVAVFIFIMNVFLYFNERLRQLSVLWLAIRVDDVWLVVITANIKLTEI